MLATIGPSMIPLRRALLFSKKSSVVRRDFSGSDVAPARPLRRGRGSKAPLHRLAAVDEHGMPNDEGGRI